jgi:hypothetical protein
MTSNRDTKLKIIAAGHRAIQELIKVAEEPILGSGEEGVDLAADKLKNAAATKRLAIFDAFDILNKIESEKEALDFADKGISKVDSKQGFAERRSK